MAKKKSLYNVQAAFRSNPGADTLYVTNDGLSFKVVGDANRHAGKLVAKATPAVMPTNATQLANVQAAMQAAGVVTPVAKGSVKALPPLSVAKKATTAAVTNAAATAAPAVAPVVLTYAQATTANEVAQVALTAAQGKLTAAQKNLADAQAALGTLPTPTAKPAPAQTQAKRKAQLLVNSCTAAVAEAQAVVDDAEFTATLAAQTLANTPAAQA